MSLGLLAINTSNTAWTTSITDIISFGSQGSAGCFMALTMLKSICVSFDTKVFDTKRTHLTKVWLRENMRNVLQFVNNVLAEAQNHPQEITLACFSAAKHWAGLQTKTLIVDESLINTLFTVVQNLPSITLFKKTINVLKNILNKSTLAKALTNRNFNDVANG